MQACPIGPEWDLLVKEVGPFQAYRDYLQTGGEIRTPSEVKSKLQSEGVLTSIYPAHQYQLERTQNSIPPADLNALKKLAETLTAKFPGYAYKIENLPNENFKGVLVPSTDPRAVGGKPTIIINGAKASKDTPLHEFGHVLLNMVKAENTRLYFGLLNKMFDSYTEEVRPGEKVTKYRVKAKYKEEFAIIEALYPIPEGLNDKQREAAEVYQIEELMVEMMGRFAAEFYDDNGEFKDDHVSRDKTLQSLSKALRKIWETIKNMLLGGVQNIDAINISPDASLDDLAIILANPNIAVKSGELSPAKPEIEKINNKILELTSLYNQMDSNDVKLVQLGENFFYLTTAQEEALKKVQEALLWYRNYVDAGIAPNMTTPKIETGLKYVYQKIKEKKTLLGRPLTFEEYEQILDEPRLRYVKIILQTFFNNHARFRLYNNFATSTEGSIRSAIASFVSDLNERMLGNRRGYDPNTYGVSPDAQLGNILKDPGHFLRPLFVAQMAPVGGQLFSYTTRKTPQYRTSNYDNLSDAIFDEVAKLEENKRNTKAYREATFTLKYIDPATGQETTEDIDVDGTLQPNGLIKTNFRSDKFSFGDAEWIVPATEDNVKARSIVSYNYNRYGVVEVSNGKALILPGDGITGTRYKDWYKAIKNKDYAKASEIANNHGVLRDIQDLKAVIDMPNRVLEVMGRVIDTVSSLFADADYAGIEFTPASGSSSIRDSGEERERIYNLMFARTFGRYSTVKVGDRGHSMIVPTWYRSSLNVNQPVFQLDRTPDSIQEFAESTDTSLATVAIEPMRASISVTPETTSNTKGISGLKALLRNLANKLYAKALANQFMVGQNAIKYEFIDAAEAAEITKNKTNPWNGEKAFFIGDTVYFVGDRVTMGDMFHEFSHPFVRSLYYQNREMFNKIYRDLLKTPEGLALYRQMKIDYPELSETDPLFAEEMIVRTLTAASGMEQRGEAKSDSFASVLKDLMFALRQMLRQFFGKSINASKLTPNTNIVDLVNMLKEGQVFEIADEALEDIDTVAYIRDTNQYVTDLLRISKPELIGLTVRAHDIALKQIDAVSRNRNYEEIASLLADEFKRGDLQEMKRNLSKFAKPLEDKLRQKRDEVEYNKAHATAMVNTFFRLQNMTDKIRGHMLELSKDKDNIDNMHKAVYYNYLLDYWSKYIAEVIKTMNEAGVPTSNPLYSLVTSIDGNIKGTQKYTKDIYERGSRDVIYSQLMPMAENIDKRYKGIIQRLKDRNASPKLIDSWMVEYTGLTQVENDERDTLQSLKDQGKSTFEQNKRLAALDKKSLDGAQITEQKIEKALKGELKDGNVFNAFFEGYMYSADPVVGGFALYVKNQMSDVMNKAMGKFNDYARDMAPLLKAAGYSGANVNALIERVARVEKIGRINEKGEWEERDVWTLKSAHKNWRIDLDRARYKVDEAHKEYSQHNTDETYKALIQAIADRKKLLRDYFHQEYQAKVYARDYMLEQGYRVVTINGKQVDVGLEAAYLKDRLFELMGEITNSNTSQLDELQTSDKMDDLWRQYHQLFSLVDANGKMKTGLDKEIAVLLKEYREASKDPDTGESYFEWKPRTGLFENSMAQFEQELAQRFAPGSPAYEREFSRWVRKNSRVAIKKEYFDEIRSIMADIESIMSKLPDSTKKKYAISETYSKIMDLVAGNRDDDGQPNGMNFTQKGIEFIKQQQELLNEMMKGFANLSGLNEDEASRYSYYWDQINNKVPLSAAEQSDFNNLRNKSDNTGLSKLQKEKLFASFAKLDGLRKKEATTYYCLIMNNQLSKLDTAQMMRIMNTNNITSESADLILQGNVINSLLGQSAEFDAWFYANHIQKEVYDQELGAKKPVWQRIYVWNVTRPVNEDFYEKTVVTRADGRSYTIKGLPAMKYYSRVVKPQYRTERIIGNTVDNQGNFLPRLDIPNSPYIDQDYLNMQSTDPKHYAILEKMKEHHLRNQEGLSYRSRLYLDIPRYRKNALEVLRTKKLSAIAGDVGEDNFPILQLMIERFKNFFRKAKDEKGEGYAWEDDAMLVRADMFDNEVASVPITGLYDLDINDVSPDVNQSLMRYMFSAERQKKLIEINPVARALQSTLNNPDNFAKEMNKINKFNFMHRGIMTYLNKKGKYVRQYAVNNFIEREFEGITDVGWTAGMPFLQNVTKMMLSRSSLAFFALNFPSAIKNVLGAKYQGMIMSAGGIDIDPISMAKGEGWAFNTMSQVSFNTYARGPKPLNMQIADSFDAIRGRAETKLPESLSRTFLHDVANFSYLTNFRKWTEDEAALQLFAGMMYKKKITRDGKEINYMEAWEQVDGQLKLKDGIDVRYSNMPTNYTLEDGDTLESLAKKFNMTKEDLQQSIKGQSFKTGKEIKIDNLLYKAFRNRFHTVQMNLNGAYDKFDQPEAARYLAYRMIAFLKRYFTPMFINRWAFSGNMFGPKRGRYNPGLGDMQEGYYVTTLKMLSRTFKYGTENWAHMTPEEHAAWKKTVVEIIGLLAILSVLVPMLGFDPTDPDRYEKMRQRSGNLPFFGLSPEDPEHPWNAGGWLTNHAILMALQVRAENEAFVPYPGFGLDNYYETFTDASSLSFGATLKTYKEMIELAYMEATGNQYARYQKDSGPYEWQKEGGSKLWTSFWKSVGFTGGTLDPITATKNNPTLASSSSSQ
jgi:hypothetical protein